MAYRELPARRIGDGVGITLPLQQLHGFFRQFGAFDGIGQHTFCLPADRAFIGQRRLGLSFGGLGQVDLVPQRLQLFFKPLGEFAQLGGGLPFPAGDFHRFGAGEFRVADFGLQGRDLGLCVMQGAFGSVPSGGFGGQGGFGALQAAGLRRGGTINGGIATNHGHRDFAILHEAPPMQALRAALLAEAFAHSIGLFAAVMIGVTGA